MCFFCRSISKILPLKLFLGYIFWGPKWITFWQKYFFSRLRNTSNRRNTKGQGLQLIPRPFGGPHHWSKELLWKQSRNIEKQPKTTIDFRNFATMIWGKVLAHMICSIYLVFWQKKDTFSFKWLDQSYQIGSIQITSQFEKKCYTKVLTIFLGYFLKFPSIKDRFFSENIMVLVRWLIFANI